MCSGLFGALGRVLGLLVLGVSLAVAGEVDHSTMDHTAHKPAAGALAGIVGMAVTDFELADHNGKLHRLPGAAATVTVLMTQGNGCPIVRNAMPALSEVRDDYQSRGVQFLLLNPNLQDDADSIASEVDDFGWDMPVLIDATQHVGEMLQVTRTAEIFVIAGGSGKVMYHGPVDDRLTYQRQRAEAQHTYLRDALDAVLADKAVPVAQVDAPGCIINFPNRRPG